MLQSAYTKSCVLMSLSCSFSDTVTELSGVAQSLHCGSSPTSLISYATHINKACQTLPCLLASSQRLPAVAVPAELPTVLRNGPALQITGKTSSAAANRHPTMYQACNIPNCSCCTTTAFSCDCWPLCSIRRGSAYRQHLRLPPLA